MGQPYGHGSRGLATDQPMGMERGSWSWAISLLLLRCVPPSVLLLSRLCTKRRLTLPLPPRGMGQQPWPCPGRLAASRVKTLPFNRMARCAVRLANRWLRMSGAEKPTGACVWSMRPASAGVVPALCVNRSMAGQHHRQASPGERAAASPRRWFRAPALA
jgi:hypothetical protein